jgi:hypothetical protein
MGFNRESVLSTRTPPCEADDILGCGAFGAKKEDRPEGAPCMYNLLEIPRDQLFSFA